VKVLSQAIYSGNCAAIQQQFFNDRSNLNTKQIIVLSAAAIENKIIESNDMSRRKAKTSMTEFFGNKVKILI